MITQIGTESRVTGGYLDIADGYVYTHWYKKPGDSFDPRGHLDIADSYDTETTCPMCLEQGNGQSWIQCPLCNRWYHEPCCEK